MKIVYIPLLLFFSSFLYSGNYEDLEWGIRYSNIAKVQANLFDIQLNDRTKKSLQTLAQTVLEGRKRNCYLYSTGENRSNEEGKYIFNTLFCMVGYIACASNEKTIGPWPARVAGLGAVASFCRLLTSQPENFYDFECCYYNAVVIKHLIDQKDIAK